MNRILWQSGVVASLALLGTACATTGSGIGEARGGGPGVSFQWRAEDAVKGHMTAMFPDGRTYSGELFQITSDTRLDDMTPLWAGWHRGWGWRWGAFPYWDAGPDFVTHYTGRVVANLTDAHGDHMRCKFRLVRPARGMASGGQGKCQLSGGNTIDATFPAA